MTDGLRWARGSRDISRIVLVQQAQGELLLFQAAHDEANAALEEATVLFRRGGVFKMLVENLALQAKCLLALDQPSRAEVVLAEARSYLMRPEDWGRLPAPVAAAEGLPSARHGDWSRAAERFGAAVQTYRTLGLEWDEVRSRYLWGRSSVTWGPLAERAHGNVLLAEARDRWAAMGAMRFAEQAACALDLSARGARSAPGSAHRPEE